MAPLTRISGPSVPPQSKLFASLIAPSDTRILSKTPVKHRVEQIDDDEDTPIFVKVRYNPEVGGMPSEEAVRRAIDQQLQQSNRRRREEPIIVNFLEQTKIPQVQRHFPPVRSFQQFRTVPHLPPQPVIYRPAYTALPNHHQGSSNTLLTNKGLSSLLPPSLFVSAIFLLNSFQNHIDSFGIFRIQSFQNHSFHNDNTRISSSYRSNIK